MAEGKVGRPRRDPERAKRVGERIASRLAELNLSQTQFAKAVRVTQPAVWAWRSGKVDATASPFVGRIAKELLWTIQDLIHAGSEFESYFDTYGRGSGHLAIESRIKQALSNILGEPLGDISQFGLAARSDPLCVRRALCCQAEWIIRSSYGT